MNPTETSRFNQDSDKKATFLTAEEALDAITFDFRHYGPQVLLFSEVIRVLTDGRVTVEKDTQKQGLWIGESGQQNMRWLEQSELIEYMCQILRTVKLDTAKLAALCARVFQSRAYPDRDPETGKMRIRIEIDTANYHCRQCGQCCRFLDYHKEITADDVAGWEKLGRTDILEWVGRSKNSEGNDVFQIWMVPGTRQLAEICPFLYKIPTENRWICKIHAVKPSICRNYPVSSKHARMTGCPGFESIK